MYKIASSFSFSIFEGLKMEKLLHLDCLIKPAFLQFAIRVLRDFRFENDPSCIDKSSLKITIPFLCPPEFDDLKGQCRMNHI